MRCHGWEASAAMQCKVLLTAQAFEEKPSDSPATREGQCGILGCTTELYQPIAGIAEIPWLLCSAGAGSRGTHALMQLPILARLEASAAMQGEVPVLPITT